MKMFFWIIKLLLFFIVLTFAVKNTDVVTVRYYLGLQWQAPMILVILAVFCVGAVAGVVATSGVMWRQRREISRLNKHAKQLDAAAKATTTASATTPVAAATPPVLDVR